MKKIKESKHVCKRRTLYVCTREMWYIRRKKRGMFASLHCPIYTTCLHYYKLQGFSCTLPENSTHCCLVQKCLLYLVHQTTRRGLSYFAKYKGTLAYLTKYKVMGPAKTTNTGPGGGRGGLQGIQALPAMSAYQLHQCHCPH